MASQSVARSESIAASIPTLELLITEAMDELNAGSGIIVPRPTNIAHFHRPGRATSEYAVDAKYRPIFQLLPAVLTSNYSSSLRR
jgi:hypothetical protein